MCMHDNPLRIKVEVEDAGASPSPAPMITGMNVETKDLMLDVGSLKAFAEAITVESATAVASVAAEESAAAAAAVTMMGMVGGAGWQFREAACKESHPRLCHGHRGGECAFMDRNIIGSHVEVVGIGESQ